MSDPAALPDCDTSSSGLPVENSIVTIVMYHYVRDLRRTAFPGIKGLTIEAFEGQLDYIGTHYRVCTLADVLAASRGQTVLPSNACVLTFDDGLADHYHSVFPRLLKRGFTGAFFPPCRPIEEHRMLDVHRLHFVLAAVTDYAELGRELLTEIGQYRNTFRIAPDESLLKEFHVASRFDPAEVLFIKRMLQWVLPEEVRSAITKRLFTRFVSSDEATFARDLYMTPAHLREMASTGMEIGGHGYNHVWLGRSSRDVQVEEIRKSASFIDSLLGRPTTDWSMSYPYGSYNADTLQLLAEHGCAIGLTTDVALSNTRNPLELARLDTNDLPRTGTAEISPWTVALTK